MSYRKKVSISISLNTKAPKLPAFDQLLHIGSRAAAGAPVGLMETWRLVKGTAELSDYGYLATDEEYKAIAAAFLQLNSIDQVALYTRDIATSLTATLDILLATQSFSAFTIQETDATSLAEAGAWASANDIFFFGRTSDMAVLSDTHLMGVYMLHNDVSNYPELSLVGKHLPKFPGSAAWFDVPLDGYVGSNFSAADRDTIYNANAMTLDSRNGFVYTSNGKTMAGYGIDALQARQIAGARVELSLFNQRMNGGFPKDQFGIDKAVALIDAELRYLAGNGLIAEVGSDADAQFSDDGKWMYKVHRPLFSDMTTLDKANGHLAGITWSFVFRGQWETLLIEGSIQ